MIGGPRQINAKFVSGEERNDEKLKNATHRRRDRMYSAIVVFRSHNANCSFLVRFNVINVLKTRRSERLQLIYRLTHVCCPKRMPTTIIMRGKQEGRYDRFAKGQCLVSKGQL